MNGFMNFLKAISGQVGQVRARSMDTGLSGITIHSVSPARLAQFRATYRAVPANLFYEALCEAGEAAKAQDFQRRWAQAEGLYPGTSTWVTQN